MVNLRLAGFLNKPLTATMNRKILLCHQAKVSLKEQFSWASDWLLTQKLAAEFPVARGNLNVVEFRRTERQAWSCTVTLFTCRVPLLLTPSGLSISFLEIQALPSGLVV